MQFTDYKQIEKNRQKNVMQTRYTGAGTAQKNLSHKLSK